MFAFLRCSLVKNNCYYNKLQILCQAKIGGIGLTDLQNIMSANITAY